MKHEDLPPEVTRFLRAHIDSVGQLELLLLLHASPQTDFSARQINDRLRSNVATVEGRLAALQARGLVTMQPGPEPIFRYAPKSDALRNAVDQLARVNRDFRGRVIDFIYAPEKMRSFSDAFRLKEEKEGDKGAG